ncbi:Protein argonaute-3 [Trichoplax sp. H2]|nr:Protein argonaute-3 [Trichoplax sp. H2]|eukprot:RDD37815.1 Protein argonaute-3 [Trichoplax sp. H2]
MSTERAFLPQHGAPGQKEQKIIVFANHFAVKFNPRLTIYHYDMTIEPTVIGKDDIKRAYEVLAQKYRQEIANAQPVFDGSRNLYSSSPLADIDKSGKTFSVDLEGFGGKLRQLQLIIKQVAVIRLQKLVNYLAGEEEEIGNALQAMDIVLRYLKSKSVTTVGKSIFSRQTSETVKDLGSGHIAWMGYFQSLHPGQGMLTLNVDTVSTAFYQESNLVEFCCNFLGGMQIDRLININDANLARLKRELKGRRVETRHGPFKRKYPITDFTKIDSRRLMFNLGDVEISVEKYIYQRYGIQLQYPRLFCVQLGKAVKKIFLPLELCFILPAQRYLKKLSDREVAEMIRFTAKPAKNRKSAIESSVNEADFKADPHARRFELEVNNRMIEIQARVLPPLPLKYDGTEVEPRGGRWDLKSKQFVECGQLCNWTIITFGIRKNDRDVDQFINSFMRFSSSYGISVQQKPNVISIYDIKEVEGTFCNFSRTIQLVVVILPNGRNDVYAEVKRMSDVFYLIPTQCVLSKNLKKCNPQFVGNLCLKINLKLGGINAVVGQVSPDDVPYLDNETFIVGADVSHSGRNEIKPSIAALVGTLNPSTGRYYSNARIMPPKQEIIQPMEEMMKELLIAYYNTSSIKPKRIIVYRDGVSDGQFAQVKDVELQGIISACRQLEEDYLPSITFIVTKKRHHSRFFCKNHHDSVGRAGNVPPGTVVDSGIVSARKHEFYLCSHLGIQGTSRPTHYVVLHDDIKIPADRLQRLTYALCHMFTRCTTVVSLPAPTYYAHLLAYRFRQILNAWGNSDGCSTVGSEEGLVDPSISDKILESIRMRLFYKNYGLFFA